MDLRNSLPQAAGTQVLVNGTRYEIDKDGIARDVKPDDAKRLLQGSAWSVFSGQLPKRTPEPQKAPQTAPPPPVEPEASPEDSEASEGAGEPSDADSGGESEEEWPDPKPSMKKEFLQSMADAYEVEYDDSLTKKELCKRIMAVMYPGE